MPEQSGPLSVLVPGLFDIKGHCKWPIFPPSQSTENLMFRNPYDCGRIEYGGMPHLAIS